MLRLMGAVFLLYCFANIVSAAEIYQWKDAAGVTHFTDNEMSVPEQYRKAAKRNVDKLRASTSVALNREKTLWLDKCASCHTLGESDKDKLGLGKLTVNPQTKLPTTVVDLLPILRKASDGSLSKMKAVQVSDAELERIADFILGVK